MLECLMVLSLGSPTICQDSWQKQKKTDFKFLRCFQLYCVVVKFKVMSE